MPDHDRPTGTTSTNTTAANATQRQGNSPFFPRSPRHPLQPNAAQTILQQLEAPIRRWLDNNSSRVSSYNEGDLITLIRRNVSEAAAMGEGSIRSTLRAWAQDHDVRIPSVSLMPLTPQQVPTQTSSSGGVQLSRLQFSIGDFNVNIQLPSEAVARLPISLGGRNLLTFRLSAALPGNFSFSAVYDGIPHIRVGIRAGVSIDGRAPLSADLFVESQEQVCQARTPAQLRASLQSAGTELKNAIEAAQKAPIPQPGETGFDFAMRWAQVGIKVGALHEAIESARRNECTNQPRFSLEVGAQMPLNPPQEPRSPQDVPSVGANFIWRF